MKIKYYHFRFATPKGEWDSKGGVTVCLRLNTDFQPPVPWSAGVAVCSRKDQFCRKTGREIAYRRSLGLCPTDDPLSLAVCADSDLTEDEIVFSPAERSVCTAPYAEPFFIAETLAYHALAIYGEHDTELYTKGS